MVAQVTEEVMNTSSALLMINDNNNNNNSTVNAHLDVPHYCSAMTNIAIKIRAASPAVESHTNTYSTLQKVTVT
jgi:uncharacterized protein YcnI